MASRKLARLKSWMQLRFGTKPVLETVVFRRVTKTPWYYGDGAALLLLLGVLVATGCFLALDYSSSTDSAYGSMVQITFKNTLGWFLRALHYWSAGMMVVVSIIHLARHILLGGYLPPREGTWFIGVGLFVLIMINSFTGYTLRWDERAIYAIRIPLNIFHHVPLIGEEINRFVLGGDGIGGRTLTRLYAVHVLFVPFMMLALAGYHLYLVILHGTTTVIEQKHPPSTAEEQIELRDRAKKSERHGEDFHPYTAFESGLYAFMVFSIAVGLSLAFGPSRLYPEANLVESSMPQEEWWWSWFSALAAYLPPWLAPFLYLALPIAILIILLALPLVDRSENRGAKRRPLSILSISVVVIGILVLSGLRLKSPWTAWPTEEVPRLPAGYHVTESVEQGRQLFTRYGCHNCHAIGGKGSGFGPNLTGLDVRLSPTELRNYILQPPEGVAMPAYRDRLPEEDLQRLVEFVLVAQTFPRKY